MGWAWMAHETKRSFQHHVDSLSCIQVLDTAACSNEGSRIPQWLEGTCHSHVT